MSHLNDEDDLYRRREQKYIDANQTAAPVQQAIEALEDALNLLDDARSGYISGCSEDLKWDAHREEFRKDAAQALAAARREQKMREACKAAYEHTSELREAWRRGVIDEHDGSGGTRSNRNVDVNVLLREALKGTP